MSYVMIFIKNSTKVLIFTCYKTRSCNLYFYFRERKSSFFGDAGLTNLQRSLTELFGAGSETSATTLLFAFLYMIKHPEIQVSLIFFSLSRW